jgi:hypothetical protein
MNWNDRYKSVENYNKLRERREGWHGRPWKPGEKESLLSLGKVLNSKPFDFHTEDSNGERMYQFTPDTTTMAHQDQILYPLSPGDGSSPVLSSPHLELYKSIHSALGLHRFHVPGYDPLSSELPGDPHVDGDPYNPHVAPIIRSGESEKLKNDPIYNLITQARFIHGGANYRVNLEGGGLGPEMLRGDESGSPHKELAYTARNVDSSNVPRLFRGIHVVRNEPKDGSRPVDIKKLYPVGKVFKQSMRSASSDIGMGRAFAHFQKYKDAWEYINYPEDPSRMTFERTGTPVVFHYPEGQQALQISSLANRKFIGQNEYLTSNGHYQVTHVHGPDEYGIHHVHLQQISK